MNCASTNYDPSGGEIIGGKGVEGVICLICGTQSFQVQPTTAVPASDSIIQTPTPVVKLEPMEGEESEEVGVGGGEDYGGGVSQGQPLVEGELKVRVIERSILYWDEEERLLFSWLSKWLHLRSKGVRWNWEVEPFPLCRICKDQLTFLLDVRRKIEELEGAWRGGVEELNEKVNRCELDVQVSGVYERDSRYLRVRREVAECQLKTSALLQIPVVKLTPEDVAAAEAHFQYIQGPPIQDEDEEWDGDRLGDDDDDFQVDADETDDDFDDEPPPPKRSSRRGSSRAPAKAKTKVKAPKRKLKAEVDPLSAGETDVVPKDRPRKSRATLDENGVPRKVGRPKKIRIEPPPPDSSEEEVNLDFDEDDSTLHVSQRHSAKGTKKTKIDPVTGIVTTLNVQFKPLGDDLYSCTKCSETIKKNLPYKNNSFRKHVLLVHSKRNVCPKCGYRAMTSGKLDYHINARHKGIKIPARVRICESCGKNLHTSVRLHRHRWNHHYTEEDKVAAIARGEKPPPPNRQEPRRQCEDCGALIARSGMSTHKLTKHGTQEEQSKAKVLCNVCGKAVFSFQLGNHMRQSHPEAIGISGYSCDQCDKVFKIPAQLKIHKRTHQNFPFKCPICGRGFRTDKSFTGHMNLHNDLRPFQCQHCPFAFASQAQFWKHNRNYHRGRAPKRPAFVRGLPKSCRKAEEVKLPEQDPLGEEAQAVDYS